MDSLQGCHCFKQKSQSKLVIRKQTKLFIEKNKSKKVARDLWKMSIVKKLNKP